MKLPILIPAALLAALAACSSAKPLPDNMSAASAASGTRAPAGSARVVDQGGYQAAIARKGDTVGTLARSIGASATELAAYNGLTPDTELHEGDEIVLPPDMQLGAARAAAQPAQSAQPAASGWSPDVAASAIDRTPGEAVALQQPTPVAPAIPEPPRPPRAPGEKPVWVTANSW